MLTDALIVAARSGDRHAVNAFLTECLPTIQRTVWRVLGQHSAADDAIQESLLKVWQRLHQYADGNLTGWLVRIATNTCYDILRHQRRQPVMVDYDNVGDLVGDSDPLEWAMRDEQAARVRMAVDALGEHHKNPVVMVCLQGLEYTEAATALGVRLGTIKSSVFRGKMALREMLTGEN